MDFVLRSFVIFNRFFNKINIYLKYVHNKKKGKKRKGKERKL